jgi:V8-like Glu-specific endopeptidase
LAQEASSTSAANAPRAATNHTISSPANEDARIQAVADYWTVDRLAEATPMPVPREAQEDVSVTAAPAAGPVHSGAGGLPTYRDPASTEKTSGRFPLSQGDDSGGVEAVPDAFSYEMPFSNYRAGNRNTYPYSTIGKLFFTIPPGNSEPAGNYVCSASVAVKSYFVVTARHCVFDIGSGKFYTNWVFYPGWNNGSDATLHGAWYPELVATWVSTNTRSLTTGWDIALMAMHDSTNRGCGGNTGRTIGTYTGWLGYSYGGSYAQRQWNIFGYPQGAPFEGNYLYQDNGATGVVNPFGSTNVVEVGNPQTGGTSGGPWVIGFDPGNATDPSPNNNINPTLVNLANGVNSFIWTRPSQPLALNGTVFQQSNFWNLYTFLNAQKCS